MRLNYGTHFQLSFTQPVPIHYNIPFSPDNHFNHGGSHQISFVAIKNFRHLKIAEQALGEQYTTKYHEMYVGCNTFCSASSLWQNHKAVTLYHETVTARMKLTTLKKHHTEPLDQKSLASLSHFIKLDVTLIRVRSIASYSDACDSAEPGRLWAPFKPR
jgi:hypothetical protein